MNGGIGGLAVTANFCAFWHYIKCKHWANAHFWFIYIDIQLQLQFRQIPMTAVAVEYRPAMGSCMVGKRLYSW